MLKSWGLTNFKSIYNADIELAPLTVLTGTNSSGKSSFIQSILLIAQTMQNRFYDRSLVLNGNLVDLGQFDDIKSIRNDDNYAPIGIRFEFTCKGHIGKTKKLLDESKEEIAGNKNAKEKYFDEYFDNFDEEDEDNDNEINDIFSEDKEYNIKFDLKFHSFHKNNLSDDEYKLFRKEQLSPRIISIKHEIFGIEYDEPSVVKIIAKENDDNNSQNIDIYPSEKIFPLLEVENWDDTSSMDLYSFYSSMFLPIYLRLFHFWPIRTFGLCNEDLREKWKGNDNFSNKISKNGYFPLDNKFNACFYEFNTFLQNIKYIGPLRHHAQLYPFSKAADPKDVGISGEYTAAVLDANMDEKVIYIPSENFNDNLSSENKSIEKPLEEALTDWLKYLGVANEVKSQITKYGYELHTDNINLFNVGTGVSQVLPILVSCLLAEPDSTLIFEQPELHLHPRVQSRLVDFFISMAMLNKQCIIETHSEYFIDKLRLRICQSFRSKDEEISNNMNIYFFNKENQETNIKKIEINEYAAMSDWPDGFFDESSKIADEIFKEASMKWKRNKEETK